MTQAYSSTLRIERRGDLSRHLRNHRADLERRSNAEFELEAGDAILLHTGWGNHWGKDNVRYAGFARHRPCGCRMACQTDPMLVGADNSSVEVFPIPMQKSISPFIR